MVLRPRKFVYQNRQKNRKFIFPNLKYNLHYGQFGLRLLQPSWLFGKQMHRFKMLIKKGSRRSDKTRRKSWLACFPHLPLTKKVVGSRMGKGKGRLNDWISIISAGTNIVEYKNLRSGRAMHFLKQLSFKLNVRTLIIYKYRKTRLFLSDRRKVYYERKL